MALLNDKINLDMRFNPKTENGWVEILKKYWEDYAKDTQEDADRLNELMNQVKENIKTVEFFEVTMVVDDGLRTCHATFTPINNEGSKFTHEISMIGFFNLGEIWQKKITKSGKTKLTKLSEEEAEKVKQQFKKKPLFVTEDGVEMYDGDTYMLVDGDLNVFLNRAYKGMILVGLNKRFSTKQAAEAYIAKKKKITYEDVAKELFDGNPVFCTTICGEITNCSADGRTTDPNNSRTSHQLEKLLALNKLMNVAVYLNPKGEKADWVIAIETDKSKPEIKVFPTAHNYGQPFFTSMESARQAIEILSEDVVRLALS